MFLAGCDAISNTLSVSVAFSFLVNFHFKETGRFEDKSMM